MSGPGVYLTVPPLDRFKFPPEPLPRALPAPVPVERLLRSPFGIDPQLYNDLLDWKVPVTFAACYIVTVFFLNAYNRSRKHKPWWISTTRFFKTFVVLHNVLLALYSMITFVAMFRAIGRVLPDFSTSTPPAYFVDALCKIQGPRGLGDAVTYNTTLNIWETKNTLIHLAQNGTPDPTDVGRLWGEGLAFWGWFFYLSKFYEVLDTLIILAKGKRSPTLQTYHHAGAMLCMWAGIRYMSPPIWMFVFINSFIHSLMYVYFTLAAINIRVPQALKRTLTTMQITQFLVGASYATLHLFIQYDIPITTMYKVLHPVTSVASAASSTAVSLTSSAAEAASSPALAARIMRLLLRAAGDEGVAENVRDNANQIILPGSGSGVVDNIHSAVQHVAQKFHEETIYRTEYTKVDCLDTSGQSFAVWLNVFYLFPLTVLFVRFFIRAYYYRTSNTKQSKRHATSRSAIDAAKGVDREIDEPSKAAEREVEKDIQAMRKGEYTGSRQASGAVRRLSQAADSIADALSPRRAGRALSDAADAMEDAMKNVKEESINSRLSSNDNSDSNNVRDAGTDENSNNNLDNSTLSVDHDSGDDSHSELEGHGGDNENMTASQKKNKKRRNRKHKKHAEQAGGADSQTLAAPSSAAHTDPKAGKEKE